jgi:hypothetical protein
MPRTIPAAMRLPTLEDVPLIRNRITIDTGGIYP